MAVPGRRLTKNQFKADLFSGRKQIGYWLTTDSISITEDASNVGFDWLLLDMEHTTLDLGRVIQHVLAARGGTAELVVRVPSVDTALVKRLLDSGVRNLMFPYVQSAEEARLAVASSLYPPDGIRGYNSHHRGTGYGDWSKEYLESYRNEQCIIVQAESPAAIAEIPQMAEIDGLDSIFVGPGDLSFNMATKGDTSAPEVQQKIREALHLIKRGRKAAGILNFDPAEAEALMREGFDYVAVFSDAASAGSGARKMASSFPGRS